MKIHALISFLFIFQVSFSQKRNNVWTFGHYAAINFNGAMPVADSSGIISKGSCASICDTSGALQFYVAYDTTVLYANTDPIVVYDKNHNVMQNGNFLKGSPWYHEIIIIPDPFTTSEYYIFNVGVTIDSGFFYAKVDMSLNGGLGAVTQKNIQLQNFKCADGLTAIKHGNGRDWWVFFRRWDSINNLYYKYLISPTGISNTIIQNIGSSTKTGWARLKFNYEGNKMVLITYTGILELYDFDRCTGLLSNVQTIFPEQSGSLTNLFWDTEFSRNGNKLYITTNLDTCRLIQLDLNAANIPNSSDTLWTTIYPKFCMGQLKLAPDNKIYLAATYYNGISFPYPYPDSVFNQYNMYLSVINYPDSVGSSCNFIPYSFYLGGKRTYQGLPNNPNYDLGALTGSPCDTLTGINTLNTNTTQLNLLPNPATNYVNITYQFKTNEQAFFTLYNSMGQEVVRKTLYGTFKSLLLHTNTYNAGMYYYKVVMKNKMVKTGKLVIGG